MGRYQRRIQQKPSRSKELLKYCLLAATVTFWLLRSKDDTAEEFLEWHNDSEEEEDYHSIRKAVPQDYGQPESEMMNHFVDHQKDVFQEKFVGLLMSAEGPQISSFAAEWLPQWVQDYCEWHRMQPIDSPQLVVKDLNYLDAALYAAAQMNRLLVIDIPETKMVERSLMMDWSLRPQLKAPAGGMKVVYNWNDKETDETMVLASTEFLQSVLVATESDIIPPSLFRYLWHSMIQPTGVLLQSIRNDLDQNGLTAGHYVSVDCKIPTTEVIDVNLMFERGKHAIQCGQWALQQAHQDFTDIFFTSNNHELNTRVLEAKGDMLHSPSGLERIVVAETLDRRPAVSNVSHDGWWIDLYIAILSRCNVYGEGKLGELSSKISNTDCQVRHEETEFGTAILCPLTL